MRVGVGPLLTGVNPHALGASTPRKPILDSGTRPSDPDTASTPPAPLMALQHPPDARQHLATVSQPHPPALDPIFPPEVVQDLIHLGPVETRTRPQGLGCRRPYRPRRARRCEDGLDALGVRRGIADVHGLRLWRGMGCSRPLGLVWFKSVITRHRPGDAPINVKPFDGAPG